MLVKICFIDAEICFIDEKLCIIVVLNIIKYAKAAIKSSHDAKQITNTESTQKQIK